MGSPIRKEDLELSILILEYEKLNLEKQITMKELELKTQEQKRSPLPWWMDNTVMVGIISVVITAAVALAGHLLLAKNGEEEIEVEQAKLRSNIVLNLIEKQLSSEQIHNNLDYFLDAGLIKDSEETQTDGLLRKRLLEVRDRELAIGYYEQGLALGACRRSHLRAPETRFFARKSASVRFRRRF